MDLINYINGERRGKDAHNLEKEAMSDPFLQDALDGFDTVDDDHMARMAAIQQGIEAASRKRKTVHIFWRVAIAASVLIVAFVGKGLFTSLPSTGLQAQNMQRPIDIYVPQNFYEENIAVIASINTELTKDLSVVTDKSEKNDKGKEDVYLNVVVSVDESAQPMNIYIPAK